MNKDFSRTITFLRKERKLSQKQAAEELEISQSLLSHYEKGIRECGLDFIIKAADYYNVSCDYLLGRTSDREYDVGEPITDKASKKQGAAQRINRRLISGMSNVIYDYTAASKNRRLDRCVTTFIMLTLYKLFRQLYSANPDNTRDLFTVPEGQYVGYADAAMMKCFTDIKSMTDNGSDSFIGILGETECSPEILAEEYGESAGEIFNVIKQAENTLLKIK